MPLGPVIQLQCPLNERCRKLIQHARVIAKMKREVSNVGLVNIIAVFALNGQAKHIETWTKTIEIEPSALSVLSFAFPFHRASMRRVVVHIVPHPFLS